MIFQRAKKILPCLALLAIMNSEGSSCVKVVTVYKIKLLKIKEFLIFFLKKKELYLKTPNFKKNKFLFLLKRNASGKTLLEFL